ncbi:MAG: hydroxymethylbilane synthase, partial [Pseudomonadota bacterium]
AFAEIINGTLQLRGFVAQPDGKRIVSNALNGKPETGIAMGQQLARKLIAQGADEILASLAPADGWK